MSFIKMTFSGAFMILLIVIIRSLITCRLPKRALLVFWSAALLRLLVPYNIPTDARSLLPVGWSGSLAKTDDGRSFAASPVNTGYLGEGIDNAKRTVDAFVMRHLTVGAPRIINIEFGVRNIVWIAGMVAVALFFAAAYLRWSREFKSGIPVHSGFADEWLSEHKLKRHIEIRYSDRVYGPLSYGVFKPVILMPKNTDWEDDAKLKYILAHEYVHIRYFDAVLKFFLIAAVCVHWFNPFVWIMYVLANRDMELACDETVIKMFGMQDRKAYASMLIEMEEAKNVFAPVANNFNRNAIGTRVGAIVKMNKVSKPVLAVAGLIMTMVFLVLGTSVKTHEWEGATGYFRFPLSEIDSEYVQDRLRADGIDTGSNQYRAVIDKMMDRPDEYPVEEAYATNIVIRNQMKNYDDDGDYMVNGIAGLLITDENVESMHRIIQIPESSREEMFEVTKEEFLRENGIANGDTTRRSEVYAGMYLKMAKEDRLAAGYTMNQYERAYRLALAEAVRAADPAWMNGDDIPEGALSKVTREGVEAGLVQEGEVLVGK